MEKYTHAASLIINNFPAGPPGKRGEPGAKGPQGKKGESGGVTGGAVYTRWGRKDCPTSSKTTMLYSGMFNDLASSLLI